MAKYDMQFIRLMELSRENERVIDWEPSSQDYGPVSGIPVVVIEAENLESAKAKAARLWSEWPHPSRVAGYWLVDENNRRVYVYDHEIEYDLRLVRARSH